MRTPFSTHIPAVLVLAAACVSLFAFSPDARAQMHEPNVEAADAFEQMVESYRKRPGLTVKTEVTVTLDQGGVASEQAPVKAEATFGQNRCAILKLREYEVTLADASLHAAHSKNEEAYFTTPDDGSPYYALMNAFLDIPFPHLAIYLGEEAMPDLWMQFHQKTPWVVPTKVEDKIVETKTYQRILLTSDFSTVEILVDPDTKLMHTVHATITGGSNVQNGAALEYKHTFTYETHDEKLGEQFFAFSPGDRRKSTSLFALAPRQEPAEIEMAEAPNGARPMNRLVGQPAPDFNLTTVAGDAVSLAELRGQVVVLDFWATWCPPCRKALPDLHDVADWADQEQLPVKVVTINSFEHGDTPVDRLEAAKKFWDKSKYSLPVAMDYTDEIVSAYGVTGIPATFVIRSDGVLHTQHSGYSPDYAATLKADITAALEAVENADNE